MPIGPMQYGTWNYSGPDQTTLASSSNWDALAVFGRYHGIETQQTEDYVWPGRTLAASVFAIATGHNAASVYAWANRGPFARAVHATSYSGYAGLFEGKVEVRGPLLKPGGSFRIDHPEDPENRYLSHSFVESSERLNVYSGVVTTDENGLADVELPSYFESLNRDFSYQLTVIGQFAQAIVEQEARDHRFSIRTDVPSVRVSWLVTGIRQDPWARANPLAVEEDKPEQERGRYLYPEAHGQPRERSVSYEAEQAIEDRQSELEQEIEQRQSESESEGETEEKQRKQGS
jgi:hypothetical protein